MKSGAAGGRAALLTIRSKSKGGAAHGVRAIFPQKLADVRIAGAAYNLFIIFKYGPMYGVQIAFKDFNFFRGIGGSEWIGLDGFREVFANHDFYLTLRNTLMLNFLDLIVSFPAPLILAIMLFELKVAWFKKLSQTILYIPHFISWVIIGGLSISCSAHSPA